MLIILWRIFEVVAFIALWILSTALLFQPFSWKEWKEFWYHFDSGGTDSTGPHW